MQYQENENGLHPLMAIVTKTERKNNIQIYKKYTKRSK